MPKRYDYEVEGLTKVLNNLNREIKNMKQDTKTGILKAGLFIERESKKRTPVDTGNLKGGTYTEPITARAKDIVEIGYTAHYAPHVHEQVENHHEIGQAKFLEDAVKENKKEIIEVIKGNMEVN